MASKSQSGRKPFRVQKQQTRLSFSPLPSSSPAKDKYSSAVQDRLANVRYDGASSSPPRQDSNDGADMLPTPGPSSRPRAESSSPLSDIPSTPGKQAAGVTDDEEDEDLLMPSSKRRRTAREASVHETPVRRSSRLQNTSPVRPSTSSSRSSDVFSHVEVATSTRRPSGALSDLASAETSDEDGDVLVSKPTQRRHKNVNDTYYEHTGASTTSRASVRRASGVDDWLVGDDEVEFISSDEETTSRRRKPKPPRTPRRRSRREQEELEADLDDLRDSDQEKSAKKKRTRGGPVTTERDKAKEHFDILRRRRAGEKIPRIQDSDEDEEEAVDINLIGRPAGEVSDECSAHSSIDTEAEPEEAEPVDEDDFIEDDATGRLGRPHPDIPLEFTSFASAKPRELFPHIVEWLVKNKLAPAFTRHDALYKLAFDRVDDQVKAQAGSRLISSAWNAIFKWTILARPQISIAALPGMDDDLIGCCDACNKTNRPARYDFILSGDAYYKDSLEPVDNSDDEDVGDVDYDEAGHQLTSQTHHFYLGSHCAANAQMGHKLTHWKYHLNESILAYLEEQGVLSAEAIVARDKMKHKKREKEAEAVVDSMEEIGKIEELWKDFQNDLDDARLGMEDYQKRGGRSRGRIGVIRSSGADGRIREWRDNKYRETIRLDSDSDGI